MARIDYNIFYNQTVTSEVTSAEFRSYLQGAVFYLEAVNYTGPAPKLICKIQYKDVFTGNWYDLPNGEMEALNLIENKTFLISPNATNAVGTIAGTILPTVYKIIATMRGTASSVTFNMFVTEFD